MENKNPMDEFDKIEKLRQRANVSFEEARDALAACEGDLLDAMVYLERLGHAKAPEQSTYSTNTDEKKSYENVPDVVVRSQSENSDPSFWDQLGHLLKTAFRKSVDNYLVVSHKNEEKFRIPILLLVIILIFFNFGIIVAIVISLFFDVRYSFTGKDDLSSVNRMIDEAGTKATNWMHDSYHRESEPVDPAEREARRAAEQAEREARWEEERAAREARREEERAAREARQEEDRAAREARQEEDRAAREARREEDRANREMRKTEDRVARELQKAKDKAEREIRKARDKAEREIQKARDKAERAGRRDSEPEEDIDTSVRHETFARKEVDDLAKKYDNEDKNDK